MIIYPKKVKKGDTIGVTATSAGTVAQRDQNKLNNANKNFLNLGYNYIETDNTRESYKLVSSDGRTRAKEFMELWQNKDISWIMPATGRRIFNGNVAIHRYRNNKKQYSKMGTRIFRYKSIIILFNN